MDIKELEPGFSISHAIYPSDIEELKTLGFRAIICHRQPGEAGRPYRRTPCYAKQQKRRELNGSRFL